MSAVCSPIYDLFERIFDKTPEPDEKEYEVYLDSGRIARRVFRAGYYPGTVDPETGNKKHVWFGILGDARPDFGFWVANQYIKPIHQFYGLEGRMTPPGEEALRYWVNKTEWHVFETEDEIVEAVINCINRRVFFHY